jgi:hypothetical protein
MYGEAKAKELRDSMKGKVVSDETRKLLSEKHKGKKLTKEHRDKISINSKNRVIREDTKLKISKLKTKFWEDKKGKSMQELYGDEKASSILAKYPSRKPRSYTEEQRQLTSKNNSLRVKIYKLFMVCGSEIIGTQVQLSKYFNISTDSMKFIINNGIFKNKCRVWM